MRKALVAGCGVVALAGVGTLSGVGEANALPRIPGVTITDCSAKFRTPLEVNKPNLPTYWSPFGTSKVICYDNRVQPVAHYQQDPWGNWHDMNQLTPGNYFINVFGYPSLPNSGG